VGPSSKPGKRAKKGADSKRDGKRRSAGKRAKRASQGRRVDAPPRTVRVRALDPRAKCGAATSVERMFRVDETLNGTQITHLVFFDRHGLYCEHGRSCPAVDDVRRANRNLDWTRKVG